MSTTCSQKTIRIIIASHNWYDGEWNIVVSWNTKDKCFMISKGFYNKKRKTILLQKTEKCADEQKDKLKSIHMKRGL